MGNNRLRPVPAGTLVLALASTTALAETGPGEASAPPAALAQEIVTALPSDLSPWAMVLHADIVVKAVMAGLALASVFTWTVGIAKGSLLVGATGRLRKAAHDLAAAGSLGEAGLPPGGAWQRSRPVAALVEAARAEVARSDTLPAEGVRERAALALSRIEARAARAMARGTGLVASIGATAPFVGLFGTVWGIMNSFVGIGQAHSSSLAVVAPGIAEALLATAVGLVAAIPAVVIYNGFARSVAGYRALLGDASAEVLRHLSRDLDRRDAAAFEPLAPGRRGDAASPPSRAAE